MKTRFVAWMLVPVLAVLALPFVEFWSLEAGPFDRSKATWWNGESIQVKESGVRAEQTKEQLSILFPVENRLESEQPIGYFVLIKDLTGAKVAMKEGKYSVPRGSSYLKVPVPGFDPKDASTANYVVSYVLRAGEERILKGRKSLYHLFPHPAITTSLPESVFVDSPTRIPVRVVDAISGAPYRNQEVRVTMAGEGPNRGEFLASTDENGTAEVIFTPRKSGRITLELSTSVGGAPEVKVSSSAEVQRANKVFLSTDKPLYQPGQTMHLRALILGRPLLKPSKGTSVLLEVFDAKGNKVFKKEDKTNRFGIASTTFTLGNQIHKGTYKISLTAGATQTEKSVTVDRYVLPKYNVETKLDRDFYLPGEKVKGTLTAHYFFGKPVAKGKVTLRILDYQAKWVPIRVIEALTNEEGILEFSYVLPKKLIGQPAENGNASVMLEINVEDTGGQKRQIMKSVTIAAFPMSVDLIPESGAVVPGLDNRFFVALADPSGSPLAGTCDVELADTTGKKLEKTVKLDATGLGTVSFKPARTATQIYARTIARTADGKEVQKSYSFAPSALDAQILVRTRKTLLKVGEPLVVDILASGSVSDAFLDVTRDNQTVAMATVSLKRGKGRYSLDLDNTLSGTLAVSAYVLSNRGEFVRDTRVVFVNQAQDLDVQISMDKETYQPAGKATVHFNVKDQGGKAVQAALGIHVVDEAVFALSEARPGLLKLYFALEEELLKPSYQIGRGFGATLGQLILGNQRTWKDDPVQENAEAAIASQGDVAVKKSGLSSWSSEVEQVQIALNGYADWAKMKVTQTLRAKGCSFRNEKDFQEAVKGSLKDVEVDPWGNRIQLKFANWVATYRSAGPDGQFESGDDVQWTLNRYESCNYYYKTGGGGGRQLRGGVMMDAAIPMAAADEMDDGAPGPMKMAEEKRERTVTKTVADNRNDRDKTKKDTSGQQKSSPAVRVRSWFPETLFVENCLITDEKGEAHLDIPLADSITTWRLSSVASDLAGRIGGKDVPLRVFQDFFVDIDFPVFLTRNDEITFPVVVYNYLKTPQEVRIEVKKEGWFELKGKSENVLALQPGEVRSIQFPVRVTKVGWHALTVVGKGSEGFSDAVKRTVEVRPDGKEIASATGGKFRTDGDSVSDDRVALSLSFPKNSVEGSKTAFLQILPGLTSHVVQGMESMLKLPGGCFEQTTSSAWPNVLALRYLKETEQSTPEIEMKAMQYVNVGYQRILTFECQSGGFNWWQGDNPGNAILSAVGIMMLRDTSRVYNAVDENVIKRSFKYLSGTQKGDGSWGEERHLHAGNENLGAGSLRGTCYITWAINEGGFSESSTAKKARQFIEGQIGQEKDLYTMGLCAIALSSFDSPSSKIKGLVDRIHSAAVVESDTIHWKSEGMTLVNSWGNSANVEVSALMALAYLRSGMYKSDVPKIINYLIASKDPQGNWGYNTQASVLAMKVFLEAATMDAGDTSADVTVRLNGDALGSRHFDNFNKDVVWQVEFSRDTLKENNEIVLEYNGKGNLGYQLISSHFIPEKKTDSKGGPLSIDVAYDRTQIKVDETVRVKATFKMTRKGTSGMILATLGIPPGFDVIAADLDAMRKNGAIQKYEITGRQVILYMDELAVNEPTVVEYRIKARYPVKAQTGGAEVGFYYNRDVSARQPSQGIEVQ